MPVQLNLIFASSTTIGNNHDTGSNVPANRIALDSENYKVIIKTHDHLNILFISYKTYI